MLKGYIEGYYGRFFSVADRSAVLDHMGQLNMDFYLYGPKEDRYHRVDWNKAYPTSEEKNLRSFIRQSNKNSIKPIFAISPGLSLNKYSNKTKISLINKVTQARKLGFKDFAIFFDDINQERNEALAKTHLKVIEDIASLDIVENPLMICPTVYCKSFAKGEISDNEYLKVLAENIDPMFPILWTGDEVVSKTISLRSLKDLKKLFDNPIIIWDNLYANDYCPSRFFIGPYEGRKSLDNAVAGIGINPTGMPITDKICLERFSSNKSDKQILKGYQVPDSFLKVIPFFSSPFKRNKALSVRQIDQLLATQNDLCINWKSELQIEWSPFLWKFYLDLILLKKINKGDSEFSLEDWVQRRYSDPLTKTILRN